MRSVTVGILTRSSEFAGTLRARLKGTGFGAIAVEVNDYCRSRTDRQTKRFQDASPEVIFIHVEDIPAALTSIQVLHTAVPSAWILACTSAGDTETILKIVRAGARELIPVPMTAEQLAQALHRYAEERDRERKVDSNVKGRIYSVCSAKRGSGATTMAINVAASIAENEKSRVVLIDLDWPIGDAAAFLNIRPRFTVADALASADRLDSMLLESYMHKHGRFHVLAGLEDFGSGKMLDTTAVSQLLEVVTQTYTHAVVDLPLSLPRELLQMTTSMSNLIVAVLTPDAPSLRWTEKLLRFLAGLGVEDKVHLVLNRSRKSDEITDSDIEKNLNHPVTGKVGNDYYACIEAINSGRSVQSGLSKHLARDFRTVTRHLLGHKGQEKSRSLLGLLSKTSA